MRLLLLILLLLFPSKSFADFAFVQAQSNGTAGTAATTISITVSAIGAGNMVACVVTWSGATTVLDSVTDGTNSYTIQRLVNDAGNGQSVASAYAYNMTGSPTTITANFGSSIGYRGISCQEFSGEETGSDPLDGTNEAGRLQSCTSCSASAATLTPAANDYLIFVGSVNTATASGGVNEFTAATNFIEPTNAEWITSSMIMISSTYWIQTTATGTTGPITAVTNSNHITMVMIFEVSGGAPPVPSLKRMMLLGVGE